MKSRTREAILTSACSCLAENLTTKLEDLIRASGVSRATYLRYFQNREAVVQAALEFARDRLSSIQAPSTELNSVEQLTLGIKSLIAEGDVLRFYFLHQTANGLAFADPTEEWFGPILDQLAKEQLIDASLPEGWVRTVIEGLIYSAWQCRSRDEFTLQQSADLVTRTMLRGLAR